MASIGLDHLQGCHAFLVAGEAESVADHHLLDEVILSVFDHPEGHNVKEGVSIGVGHHRIGTGLTDQLFKRLSVELCSSDVDGRFTLRVPCIRVAISMLQQGVDHEWVPAEDSLVQSKLSSGVDLGPFLFHDHVQDGEVEVARILQELHNEILLVQKHVDVEFLQFNELEDGLDVGVLAC